MHIYNGGGVGVGEQSEMNDGDPMSTIGFNYRFAEGRVRVFRRSHTLLFSLLVFFFF